uniref:DUF834 domain-containing protein n=1 Tax=Oryza glaberrima TaxID=4538 RepID=I1PC44_ORYGL
MRSPALEGLARLSLPRHQREEDDETNSPVHGTTMDNDRQRALVGFSSAQRRRRRSGGLRRWRKGGWFAAAHGETGGGDGKRRRKAAEPTAVAAALGQRDGDATGNAELGT